MSNQPEKDWKVRPYTGQGPIDIVDGNGDLVAVVSRSTYERSVLNANLIAAAPDMAQELTDTREWLSKFLMAWYITAVNPTYENMKPYQQQLSDFLRGFGGSLAKRVMPGLGRIEQATAVYEALKGLVNWLGASVNFEQAQTAIKAIEEWEKEALE
jgi:hypothetical protein